MTGLNWPLLILVALIPLQNIYLGKFPNLGFGLNFLNVFLLLSCLVWWGLPKETTPTPAKLARPVLGYAAIMLISLPVGMYTLSYMGEQHVSAMKDLILPLLLFFVVLYSVRTRSAMQWMLAAMLFPMPYMFHVFHSQLSHVLSWHYDDKMRYVKGTFMMLGSNEIGAFYAAYTLLLIAGILFLRNPKLRILLGVLTFLNLYCLLYSFSRGAWVAFLIGLFVLIWCLRRKAAVATLIGVLLFSGVLMSFLPVAVQERFGTIVVEEGEERDRSAASRFELWTLAMKEFRHSPVIGVGYHTFHHLNEYGKDTHNYYVKVLTEQGVVGLALLMMVLARGARTSHRLFRMARDPLFRTLGLGTLCAVAAFAVGNMFGDRFSHYPLSTYLWCCLAMVQRALWLEAENRGLDVLVADALGPAEGPWGESKGGTFR
ncbi:MAG: O-antigen ligase family protein [Nitrospirota bacterium]|nr:O-antigen ligase family protein [Nitrospirota bacterium]